MNTNLYWHALFL